MHDLSVFSLFLSDLLFKSSFRMDFYKKPDREKKRVINPFWLEGGGEPTEDIKKNKDKRTSNKGKKGWQNEQPSSLALLNNQIQQRSSTITINISKMPLN